MDYLISRNEMLFEWLIPCGGNLWQANCRKRPFEKMPGISPPGCSEKKDRNEKSKDP
jgi:hypothetical protein